MQVTFDPANRFYIIDPRRVSELGHIYRPDEAPFGFKSVYGEDTDMYRFLDYVLFPSCISKVSLSCNNDGVFCVCLHLDVSFIDTEEIVSRLIPYETDPFC